MTESGFLVVDMLLAGRRSTLLILKALTLWAAQLGNMAAGHSHEAR